MTARDRYKVIASNLHGGGGVQVAASLLDEAAALTLTSPWSSLIDATDFEVSQTVARNVASGTLARLKCKVVNRRPGRPNRIMHDLAKPYAAVFTVFGPLYSRPRAHRRIMGYADVTSIYALPVGVDSIRGRLRSRLSRFELKRQDLAIVETRALRTKIEQVLGAQRPEMQVVPNAVNTRVLAAETHEALAVLVQRARTGHDLLFAYPCRDYPHKNLEYLPAVAAEMGRMGLSVHFVVTLRPQEWAARSERFRQVSTNVGEITIDQVATVVEGADALFFPSLLEAYSATPVEAMALRTPVFASDLDFVRSVCEQAAVYFSPSDPQSAARTIVAALKDPAAMQARVHAGAEVVGRIPSAEARAVAMLSALYGEALTVEKRGAK